MEPEGEGGPEAVRGRWRLARRAGVLALFVVALLAATRFPASSASPPPVRKSCDFSLADDNPEAVRAAYVLSLVFGAYDDEHFRRRPKAHELVEIRAAIGLSHACQDGGPAGAAKPTRLEEALLGGQKRYDEILASELLNQFDLDSESGRIEAWVEVGVSRAVHVAREARSQTVVAKMVNRAKATGDGRRLRLLPAVRPESRARLLAQCHERCARGLDESAEAFERSAKFCEIACISIKAAETRAGKNPANDPQSGQRIPEPSRRSADWHARGRSSAP